LAIQTPQYTTLHSSFARYCR